MLPCSGTRCASPTVVGSQQFVQVSGAPGDIILMLLGFEPNSAAPHLSAYQAALAVPPPPLIVSLGALPASGALSFQAALGPLPPGLDGLLLVGQSLHMPQGAGYRLGAPIAAVLLAEAP